MKRTEYERTMSKIEYKASLDHFQNKMAEKERIKRKEIMEKKDMTLEEIANLIATDIRSCVYDKGNQDKLPLSYEDERLSIRVIDSID